MKITPAFKNVGKEPILSNGVKGFITSTMRCTAIASNANVGRTIMKTLYTKSVCGHSRPFRQHLQLRIIRDVAAPMLGVVLGDHRWVGWEVKIVTNGEWLIASYGIIYPEL